MLQFIFTYAAIFSLGALLVLMARSWPRVNGAVHEERASHGVLEQFVLSDVPQRIDATFARATEKLFRRLKVLTLRLDNYLTGRLKRLSETTKEKPKIDFKEIENANELVSKE